MALVVAAQAVWPGGKEEADGVGGREPQYGRLGVRLVPTGVGRRNFKSGAGAFHLWHPETAARAHADNEARYDATIRERRRRCLAGLVPMTHDSVS